MTNVTFVTGNPNKVKYLSELIGIPIKHHVADVDEIQSLDLHAITAHKAKQAYEQLKVPVIVEDTALSINSMGGLPGPFIKWFEQELDYEGICRLADISPDRSAIASSVYTYYDGKTFKDFKGSLEGIIPSHPRGKSGFGWNPIFVPEGSNQTLGEMIDKDFKATYARIKMIKNVREFLRSIDKN